MKLLRKLFICISLLTLWGCANRSVVVTPFKAASIELPTRIAFTADPTASGKFDELVIKIAQNYGAEVISSPTDGNHKIPNVDLVMSYSDRWYWDLYNHLKTFDLNIFDAKTGDLLIQGRWLNTPGYMKYYDDAVTNVVTDTLDRLIPKRSAPAPKPESKK